MIEYNHRSDGLTTMLISAIHSIRTYRPGFRVMILLLFAVGAAGARGELPSLTLVDCYERATERNERVGVAAAEWRAAEERYRQVRDSLIPSIGLAGSAAFQNDRRDSPDASGNRDSESYDLRVRAEQVLYRGLRTTRLAEAREAAGRAARHDATRARELLYLDVADAFYQVLLHDRDLAVIDRLEGALREMVGVLQERVRLGRSRRSELLNAQTDLAEVRVEREAIRGLGTAARELLAFLIDTPAADIRLIETTGPLPDVDMQPFLQHAHKRSDILAGEARRVEAQREQAEAQGARQPEVQAAGEWYLWEDPNEDREWNVTLSMSLPLFDEGVIRARSREQMERVRISELNLAALRRSAERDVRSAHAVLESGLAQVARLREARVLARENYDLQQRDYELGRSSQLDVLNALAQWQRLERREIAADLQARNNLVRLHVAAGRVEEAR